jgi:hypothetical protein
MGVFLADGERPSSGWVQPGFEIGLFSGSGVYVFDDARLSSGCVCDDERSLSGDVWAGEKPSNDLEFDVGLFCGGGVCDGAGN